ncbi:hypothetical protein OAS39_08600 [Pirellulales bacterium]|nr:hypothetical protein [Pirellulales bacterium]
MTGTAHRRKEIRTCLGATAAMLGQVNRLAVAWLGLAAILGCGSGHPETVRVNGTVTIDGKPVEEGEIRFIPTGGRMAMGEIVDGKYSLRTYDENDGALVGSHRVTITATKIKRRKGVRPEPPPEAPRAEHQAWQDEMESIGFEDVEWLAPERYSYVDRSGLTADVQPGTNEIDFPLLSKKSP